jgi:hypothetical protein
VFSAPNVQHRLSARRFEGHAFGDILIHEQLKVGIDFRVKVVISLFFCEKYCVATR